MSWLFAHWRQVLGWVLLGMFFVGPVAALVIRSRDMRRLTQASDKTERALLRIDAMLYVWAHEWPDERIRRLLLDAYDLADM